MSFEQTMDDIARGVEILGVATVLVGLAAALVSGALGLVGGEGPGSVYRTIRAVFARSILLGLEFLVAADIIRTVAVQPSLENVAVLGLIILHQDVLELLAGSRARRSLALGPRLQRRHTNQLNPVVESTVERGHGGGVLQALEPAASSSASFLAKAASSTSYSASSIAAYA